MLEIKCIWYDSPGRGSEKLGPGYPGFTPMSLLLLYVDFVLCPVATVLANSDDYILNLRSPEQITEPRDGTGDFLK